MTDDQDEKYARLVKDLIEDALNEGGVVMERFAVHALCADGIEEKEMWMFATASEGVADTMISLLTLANGAPPKDLKKK